jgi:hypothetical protein
MNEKTLADLSLKLSKALCAMNSCDCQECEEKWGRVVAAFAELDAALARPPADSELDRLRMREPRREEMEAALGEANEAFYEGWTIRRCRHCRIPVAGGPTACEVCAATQDPDKNPWPPPKVAGAVGQWDAAIAAVAAERAREREVKLDVVGTSELVFGAGKWSAYRLVGPHALCIRAALELVDADTGTSLSLAIRRLPDQPKPKVLPFVKTVGEWHLIVCGVPTCSYYCYTRTFPSAWKACPSCGAKFAPRDLPGGEEVGG